MIYFFFFTLLANHLSFELVKNMDERKLVGEVLCFTASVFHLTK